MPKVRALVPLTTEKGEPVGLDEVVNVSDEQAQEWRLAGKVSLLEDEERNAKAAEQGHYGDVTTRDDVGALGGGGSGGRESKDELPGPQQRHKDDDDDERPKKGKK